MNFEQTVENNPYAAPKSEGASSQPTKMKRRHLASRGQRFAGQVIDSLVHGVVLVPAFFVVGILVELIYPQYFSSVETATTYSIELAVTLLIISVVFLALNGYLLATRGQTIGKVVMKTQIVSVKDELLPLPSVFLKRYFLMWLLATIPVFGRFITLANALAILREGKKCLHDDLAGTKVVTLGPVHHKRDLPDKIEMPSDLDL